MIRQNKQMKRTLALASAICGSLVIGIPAIAQSQTDTGTSGSTSMSDFDIRSYYPKQGYPLSDRYNLTTENDIRGMGNASMSGAGMQPTSQKRQPVSDRYRLTPSNEVRPRNDNDAMPSSGTTPRSMNESPTSSDRMDSSTSQQAQPVSDRYKLTPTNEVRPTKQNSKTTDRVDSSTSQQAQPISDRYNLTPTNEIRSENESSSMSSDRADSTNTQPTQPLSDRYNQQAPGSMNQGGTMNGDGMMNNSDRQMNMNSDRMMQNNSNRSTLNRATGSAALNPCPSIFYEARYVGMGISTPAGCPAASPGTPQALDQPMMNQGGSMMTPSSPQR
ncbi:hypothetical protein [Microcoleus sp. FACHB-831]|uniref:hypothetical protein n=1 Tax=Microcoleus sp. FACHB-831 TaxID=2692827 RepID=UPI00168454ED|nr:hypothetical protein [Microcoleus sp. FACHB-831]